jgi:hypothetical protein
MIRTEQELRTTLERIDRFRRLIEDLRRAETNPTNYRLSAAGFLSEIDRMNLEVREYLALLPSELATTA